MSSNFYKEVKKMKDRALKNPAYWVILGLSLVLSIWIYFTTPAKIVPVHLNIKGEVDGYGHKFSATFLFTIIILLMGALMAYCDKIDPYRENVRRSRRAVKPILNIVSAFMLFFQIVFAWLIKTGSKTVDSSIFVIALGVLMILLGNYLPTVKRNFFVGIRVPWTLASDEVWRRTHRLGGWLFIAVGLWMIVAALLRLGWEFWAIPAIIILVYVSIVYPYYLFKKLQA